MLVATTCLAAYSIIIKKVINKYTPLFITTYTLIISTIILLPFSINDGLFKSIPYISWKTWLSAAYMGVFATVLAYLAQQTSINKIGSVKTEVFRNLVPVFSIILTYIFFGEKISMLMLISSGIIIIAVCINLDIKIHRNKFTSYITNIAELDEGGFSTKSN